MSYDRIIYAYLRVHTFYIHALCIYLGSQNLYLLIIKGNTDRVIYLKSTWDHFYKTSKHTSLRL